MRHIGFLIFPGFNMLDLSGPLSVFETANHHLDVDDHYRLTICAVRPGMYESSSAVRMEASCASDHQFDTLVIVGGRGVEQASRDDDLLNLLKTGIAKRLVSVCTGAFILAASGLLAGKAATTHWRVATQLKHRFPDIILQADNIVVKDGDTWTSAGATAGMDIGLALIEAEHGGDITRIVARDLLIPHRRTDGQLRFMRLQEINPPSPRVQRVLAFIGQNLRYDLSVPILAEQANLSPRQFSREFTAETGLTPARAVERLRVEFARSRLENSNQSMAIIASEAGFPDSAIMRKAFLRCLRTTPQNLRKARW
ncbi:GlxA family transcriptional regulator [Thalassospira marina]|uniref:AraC family transcriptional regulator n=1 Tax=Thalassospira marina TaxID=2048283 RepID=A0A2N3KJL4_9PROT|nr:DJ-1/PfpI family protein [Thalassospira marina]PKR50734.1 AraC family transcriptional regulator [Thalassospira marina]